MSNETTPAIERATEALISGGGIGGFGAEDENTPGAKRVLAENDATVALTAALDVEEMAKVISAHRHGSTLPWAEDIRTAEVIRAALLGTTS